MNSSTTQNMNTENVNNIAIKDFFSMYGDETRQRMTSFLFDMLSLFAQNDNFDDTEYKQTCILHYTMINDLLIKLKQS